MTYAHVLNGQVVEPLVTPPDGVTIGQMYHAGLVWVDVTSASPQPQPGWTATQVGSAWTFAAPVAPVPTLAQQAAAALSAGVALVSTGTAALDGTYAIDAESRSDMMAEMVALIVNSTFTNGSTSLAYADAAGTMHTFDIVQFKAFATAIGAYVGALKAIVATGTGTLPAATVTIA